MFDVVAGAVTRGACLAVAGDRAVDETLIERAKCGLAKAEPLHDAGSELFDQHVGALDKLHDAAAIVLVLEVRDDALLATVEKGEHGALSSPMRRKGAHLFAAGLLDLDDARPCLGE